MFSKIKLKILRNIDKLYFFKDDLNTDKVYEKYKELINVHINRIKELNAEIGEINDVIRKSLEQAEKMSEDRKRIMKEVKTPKLFLRNGEIHEIYE